MVTALNGWLSPNGIFYNCEYRDHIEKATEILKLTDWRDKIRLRGLEDKEFALEQAGFIKLSAKPWAIQFETYENARDAGASYLMTMKLPLTAMQKAWLMERGEELTLGQRAWFKDYLQEEMMLREA